MSLYGYVCWVLFVHQFCVCFHLSVSYVIHSSFFSPQQRPSIFATGDGNYTNLHRHNSLDTVFRTPMGGKPSFLTPLEEAVMGCFLTGSPAMSPRFGSPAHIAAIREESSSSSEPPPAECDLLSPTVSELNSLFSSNKDLNRCF